MLLINCEINLDLTSLKDCVIFSATGKTKVAIIYTKLYFPFVTLSTQDKVKLLKKL